MGCPSTCEIGDNLVFSICTHDPDTGVLTDADSAPTYRIYEDETGTAIANGTMAKLDDANTTGFYTELIAVTTANGYESGKTYTIYIQATVDSDTGGIAYSFKATTVLSLLSYCAATMLGTVTGAQTGTEVFTITDATLIPSGTKTATATCDSVGNRTVVLS